MKRHFIWLLCGLSLCGPVWAEQSNDYLQEIQKWQQQRYENLAGPQSWLTLVGLHFLDKGPTKLGVRNGQLDLKKPERILGVFEFDGKKLSLRPQEAVLLNEAPFAGGSLDLSAPDSSQVLRWGQYVAVPVKRDMRWALRLKDSESPSRKKFKGLNYFPVDSRFRVEAKFEPFATPKKTQVISAMGTKEDETYPGEVVFTWEGNQVRLMVTGEPQQKSWMLNFADKTNGKSSYGGGRYLYFDVPTSDKVTLDFNRCFTPPCAFTHFATCTLVPQCNRLPFKLEAGEQWPAKQ